MAHPPAASAAGPSPPQAPVPQRRGPAAHGAAVRPAADLDALVAGVLRGDRRLVGRLITLLECEDPAGAQALDRLGSRRGQAHVVGVTGAPGTGKSTLVDRLIEAYRRQGLKVGVVAVDPSSPFTGGAILGDRIRMQGRSTDPGVFIRSMGTRGALGGLSHHAAQAVQALEAAGHDVVLVETVGVGQAEVDVVRLADTVLVVLVPNLGDGIQAVKAGIMEIADLFVVNKADLAGSDKVAAEVEAALELAMPPAGAWTPPILRTVAEKGDGVPQVVAGVARHREWAQGSGRWEERRRQRQLDEVRSLLSRAVARHAFGPNGQVRPEFRPVFDRLARGEVGAHAAAEEVLAAFRKAA